jgi:hypothetical protein
MSVGEGRIMALMHEPTILPVDPNLATVQGTIAYLNDLEHRLAPYFAREEPRQQAMASLRDMLSPAERQMAVGRGQRGGHALWFQHLLGRALWDPEAVRNALHTLGDPHGVLVIDETRFVKKGQLCYCHWRNLPSWHYRHWSMERLLQCATV